MTVSDLGELIGFLEDSRDEVRAMSAEIVAGLTANAEGLEKLKCVHQPLITKLLQCVVLGGDAVRKALVALVNLSHDPAVVEMLLNSNVINRVMEFIRDRTTPHVDLMTSLLANITISERGSMELLQLGKGSMEGQHMSVLLKKFVITGITNRPGGDDDLYEHVASVLTNVTRLREARLLLLQPGRELLLALVPQLHSSNALRRVGAAGALKNCIMSAEDDGTLDCLLEDRTVLTHMLRCINGQAPLEKEDTVRERIAEAILVLAGTDKGRDALWEAGAPEALRKGYEDEQHPGVCLAMERTAEIFLSHSTIDSGLTPGVLGLASSAKQQQRQELAQEQGEGEGEGQEQEGRGGLH